MTTKTFIKEAKDNLVDLIYCISEVDKDYTKQAVELAKAKELLASILLSINSDDQILNRLAIRQFFDEYGSPQSDEVMQKTT